MTTITTVMDDSTASSLTNPGAYLAELREKKGLSQEYVAGKLHLRLHLVELLEADNYDRLPEPVFVKGYLRAYSLLLGIDPEPLLQSYHCHFQPPAKKCEKALWQTKKESHRSEKAIRWVTMLFALGVLIAVSVWWQKNREAQTLFSGRGTDNKSIALNDSNPEIRLTDLSKMQALLSTNPQLSPLEKSSE